MHFHHLDMNLLVVLDALLRTRSVSRASEQLFLSRPATSCALARLRKYFNDELLSRVGRKFVLTPLAESLAKPVRESLLQVESIIAMNPNFDPAESKRKIVIEVSDYIATIMLNYIIRLARQIAPGMRFDIRVLSENFMTDVDNGEVELLIIPQALASADHPSDVLFRDRYVCVVCAENTLVKSRITPEEYLQMGHVMPKWGGGRLTSLDEQFLQKQGIDRNCEVTAPNFALVPTFVIGTDRIATLQERMARMLSDKWPIRILPCPVDLPEIVEVIQWHKYVDKDPAITWVRGLFQQVAKEHMA